MPAVRRYTHYHQWREVEPSTGRLLGRADGGDLWGFHARCGFRDWVVLKRPSDQHVILRLGRHMLDLDDDAGPIEVRRRDWLIGSTLRIRRGGRTWRGWNFTPGRLYGFVDPTWDFWDDEGEDFLLWLSEFLADDESCDRVRTL